MKKRLSFAVNENGVDVFYRKKKKDTFEKTRLLHFSNKTASFSDRLNVISVAPLVYNSFDTCKSALVSCKTGAVLTVSLTLCDTVAEDSFVATPYIVETLGLDENDGVYLCQFPQLSFRRVVPQKIDHIKESNLVLSETDVDNRSWDFSSKKYKLFEVYNSFSGESIVVKREHICVDKSLAPGSIRLSRKQRMSLSLELPSFLTEKQWQKIKTSLSSDSEDFLLLANAYPGDDRFLVSSIPYEIKTKAKQILSRLFSTEIRIIPVIDSLEACRKDLLGAICNFYVGKSTISLVCRRPYIIDEGCDVVRLSKSNMSLLGIDEMDKIILQYKNHKVASRVLSLSDNAAFFENNLPISCDLAVGVPAHIRKKLHVTDLSSSIKIDRDTRFIFRKSLNEQVVPVLLTLFSANLFTDSSVIKSAILSLFAIPIVLYFNLSQKRNMRA